MEISSSLQLNPLQVVDLLMKQLDAFVVASKGSEQIDGSVCATKTERNPVWAREAGGVHQEDCLLFVHRTAKH